MAGERGSGGDLVCGAQVSWIARGELAGRMRRRRPRIMSSSLSRIGFGAHITLPPLLLLLLWLRLPVMWAPIVTVSASDGQPRAAPAHSSSVGEPAKAAKRLREEPMWANVGDIEQPLGGFVSGPTAAAGSLNPDAAVATKAATQQKRLSYEEAELIELLAELFAHKKVLQLRLEEEERRLDRQQQQRQRDYQSWATRRRKLKMVLGLDEASLEQWLRERQSAGDFPSLNGVKFEILSEHTNRTIHVCQDGPKILVLPNISDILYCYTRDQWLEKLWSDLRLNCRTHYPIVLLNLLIFLVGATGNVFVCLSVYRNHQLRNVTNYFIVNLAAADLLVILICLPATQVWDLSLTWFFGTTTCKLVMFLQDVSVSVSVLTLTAISLDRYYAICHPLKFKSNLGQAKRAIGAIWLVSLAIMAPDLIYLAAHESQELREAGLETVLYSDCNYDWSPQASKLFQFIKTILLYLVPFMLMFWAHFTIMRTLSAATSAISVASPGNQSIYSTSCHSELAAAAAGSRSPSPQQAQGHQQSLALETVGDSPPGAAEAEAAGKLPLASSSSQMMVIMHNRGQLEARRKAVKMLTAIVVIFGLCYLPVHLVNFLRQFIDDIPQNDATSTLAMLAHSVCYLNSAINPIIYNHMNSVFRAEFKQFLASCLCRRRRRRQEPRPLTSQQLATSSSLRRPSEWQPAAYGGAANGRHQNHNNNNIRRHSHLSSAGQASEQTTVAGSLA